MNFKRLSKASLSVVAIFILCGCVSDATKVKMKMEQLVNESKFEEARNISVKHNPGGVPKTDEEIMRDKVIVDLVEPKEKDFTEKRIKKIRTDVMDALGKGKDEAARQYIYKFGVTGQPNVDRAVYPVKVGLLNSHVNPATQKRLEALLAKEGAERIAAADKSQDLKGAKATLEKTAAFLDGIKPVAAYLPEIDEALVSAGGEAVLQRADENGVDDVIGKAQEDLYGNFAGRKGVDEELKNAPPAFTSNWGKVEDQLEIAKKSLVAEDWSENESDQFSDELLAALKKRYVAVKTIIPSLTTEALNNWIKERSGRLREAIGVVEARLAEKTKAAEIAAREKAEAEEIATRVKKLRETVLSDLKGGEDEVARRHIAEFGVTGNEKVDGPVFLIKVALLNSHANPATKARIKTYADGEILQRIETIKKTKDTDTAIQELKAAYEKLDDIKHVFAYLPEIDRALIGAGNEAVELHCFTNKVDESVSDAQEELYRLFAYREGYDRLEFPSDWSKVEAQLAIVCKALVQYDFGEAKAANFVADVLEKLKANFNDHATDETLTTAELNDWIERLRAELDYALNEAKELISDRLAKMAAEKEAAAAKAAAEKKAVAEAELEKLRLDRARRAAREVDFPARIEEFVAAINENEETEINKVLGEGARVLRRHRAGAEINKKEATSLLCAAAYMDFNDVANFAIANEADVNGTSEKDAFGRTPYLLALQNGFKGSVKMILEVAKADIAKVDAGGYGALHYAVRYAALHDVAEVLGARVNPKAAAKDGVTPLMVAARLDKNTAARMLVGLSDVNAKDASGKTALHYAAAAGSLRLVKTLVAYKADVKAVTNEGDTPLCLAVMRPAEDIIAYLLDEAGAPTDQRAADWCVTNGKVLPLKTLVAHGAKITDSHLKVALLLCHHDMAVNFLENGPKTHIDDMVQYLVSLGCDVNAVEVHAAVSEIRADSTKIDRMTDEYRSSVKALDAILDFLRANGYREETSERRFAQ